MRYLTKEWATLGRLTRNYFHLVVDEDAKFKCDKYYRKLYQIEYEEMYRTEGWSFETLDKSLAFRLEIIKSKIPKRILKDVADLRVLVLGKVTKEIKNKINLFCDNNSLIHKNTQLQFNEYYQKMSPHERNIYLNLNDFKGRGINEMLIEEERFTLKFVKSMNDYKYSSIEFVNFEIIKQDCDLIGFIWDLHEVYFEEDKFEVHLLLWNLGIKDITFFELTIKADRLNIS